MGKQKVEWVILYREAPGHMGGDWSETHREYFTGTEKEVEKRCDEINRNWASVEACYPVESSPIEKRHRKQVLAEEEKQAKKRKIDAENRAKAIEAHRPISNNLYPIKTDFQIRFSFDGGYSPLYYYPQVGDCFLYSVQSRDGNQIVTKTRCFEFIRLNEDTTDWFLREIEIAPDAMKVPPIDPRDIRLEIETI